MVNTQEKLNKVIISRKNNQMREDIDRLFTTKRPLYDSSGETSLWQAVIIQAAMDIFSDSKCPKAKRAKKDAIAWFNRKNDDFLSVCSFAGLDPDFVIRGLKRAMNRFKKKTLLECLHSVDSGPKRKSSQKVYQV